MTFTIRVISYGPDKVDDKTLTAISEITECRGKSPVTWVDIEGEIDQQSLATVGELFKLHPLALEDVLNTNQRAKVEQYGDSHFLVTRMISLENGQLGSEQLSIFFGKDFVVTFQDKPGGDCLNSVRERLRRGAGRIRQENATHLAYALVDAVIDGYLHVLDTINEQLIELKDRILLKYDARLRAEIHEVSNDLTTIRHMTVPLRDAVNSMIRDVGDIVSQETKLHLRDCADHINRVMDQLDWYENRVSALETLQQGAQAEKTNEILRVLAVMSTLIMAPTLVGSIYGMNFNPASSPYNMPELNWLYGYPMALGLMALLMGGLLFWLYWKGWLSKPKPLNLTSRRARWDRAMQRQIARLRPEGRSTNRNGQ